MFVFYREIQLHNNEYRFFKGVKTFCLVQNNKPVIDTVNKLNTCSNVNSTLTFGSSIYILNCYIINSRDLNDLTNNYDGGENIKVSSY